MNDPGTGYGSGNIKAGWLPAIPGVPGGDGNWKKLPWHGLCGIGLLGIIRAPASGP